MGPNTSTDNYIRKHPIKGNADQFYFACKEGNLEYVKQVLPSLTVEQLNQMQPNGSTYLHAASYNGRIEIVRLLLDHGCMRSKLNLHGLTAYDEACIDDIRSLFHRPRDDPGENRFVDGNINETFHLTSMLSINEQESPTQTTDNNIDIETDAFEGNDWVEAFNNFDKYSALILSTTMKSKLFYRLIGLKHDALHQLMKFVLEDSFKQTDQDFNITSIYLNEYITKKTVSSVIYLYTLETSFYSSALRDTSKCTVFTMLLYRNLSQLTKRFYKGQTFRGMKMTKKDLDAYRSMIKHKGYALMNTKLQSSSIQQSIAEEYLYPPDTSENDDVRQRDVLMVYDFHETCQSAINLTQINGQYLSEYPREAEVLILPYTLFEVCAMEYDATKQIHMIYVKNIIPPGILSSFKCAMKEFMNMSPDELHQSIRRLEKNLNAMRDLTQDNSN